MKLKTSLSPTLACLLLAALQAPAAAQRLAERSPGLWQLDSLVQVAAMGVRQSSSVRLCLTPELARQDLVPPEVLQDDGWACKASALTASPERLSYALACQSGPGRALGRGEVQLDGSRQFGVKSSIDAEVQGMKVQVQSEHAARFVAEACGDAPPLRWESLGEAVRP